MKFFGILFSLLLILFSFNAQADETVFARVLRTKTINCGYFVTPPSITKDVNTGKMGGINYDLMEAIASNLGLKVNWSTEIGFGEVAVALNTNKFDVMCQTMWPSVARYSGMTLANQPLFYTAIHAVVRADDTRFDGNLEKANTKEIKAVGIEGDFSLDLAKEKLPKATHMPLASSTSLGEYFMQLTTKKADILFMDRASVNDFSKNNPGQIKVVPNVPIARVFGDHLAVKMGEYALRDMLDMATQQLINDGIFEKLVKQYAEEYNTEIYPAAKGIVK